MSDERLQALEELSAHQARLIEELNGEVTRQGEVTDRLEKTVKALAKRLIAMEEAAEPAHHTQKPPHW